MAWMRTWNYIVCVGLLGAGCTRVEGEGGSTRQAVSATPATLLIGRPLAVDTLARMKALAATLKQHDADPLDDAAKRLADSLGARLWLDDSHVDAMHGHEVFDAHRDVIHRLGDAERDKHSMIPAPLLDGFIRSLVAVDRYLATVAIDNAADAPRDVHHLAEARQDLARGDASATAEHLDQAIDGYREAWQKAIDATAPKCVGVTCTSDACTSAHCDPTVGACATIDATGCATPACALGTCGVVDSDGDGLSDAAERHGYIDVNCNGRNDGEGVDVQIAGADPSVPDVFVAYDWMDLPSTGEPCTTTIDCHALGGAHLDEVCTAGVCTGHSHDPEGLTPGALQLVVDRFAARGFRLHLRRGHALPHSHVIAYRTPVDGCEGATVTPGDITNPLAVNFYDLKHSSPSTVDTNGRLAWHYVIFGHSSGCDTATHCAACPGTLNADHTLKTSPPAFGQTGYSEVSGDDLIVSQANLVQAVSPSARAVLVAGTFMHELGHNLGMHHGGGIAPTPCTDDNACANLGPWHAGQACRVWKRGGAGACTLDRECDAASHCEAGTCVARGCVQSCAANADCTALGLAHAGDYCAFPDATTPGAGVCLSVDDTSDRLAYKPNYLSVMNYRYQQNGIKSARSVGSPVPDPTLTRVDYSSQVLPAGGATPGRLDESDLDERVGLGSGTADLFSFTNSQCLSALSATDGPVDWDGDGVAGDDPDATAQLSTTDLPLVQCVGHGSRVFVGHVDWGPAPSQSQFTYGYQCTPFFADPTPP